MNSCILLLALAAVAKAEIAQTGACSQVASGESLAADTTYRCAYAADQCVDQEMCSCHDDEPSEHGPACECVENDIVQHATFWHDHAELEAAGLSCSCEFGTPEGDETHHYLEEACYNMAGAHVVACMPAADCAAFGGAYNLGRGYQSGNNPDTSPCTCYHGGTKGGIGEFTQHGSCFNTDTTSSMCAISADECADGDIFYTAKSDDLINNELFCPCWETRTGSCYNTGLHTISCATSEDVCAAGTVYLSAATTLSYNADCFICERDEESEGDVTLPEYMLPPAEDSSHNEEGQGEEEGDSHGEDHSSHGEQDGPSEACMAGPINTAICENDATTAEGCAAINTAAQDSDQCTEGDKEFMELVETVGCEGVPACDDTLDSAKAATFGAVLVAAAFVL